MKLRVNTLAVLVIRLFSKQINFGEYEREKLSAQKSEKEEEEKN